MRCKPLSSSIQHCSSAWDSFAAEIEAMIVRLVPLNPSLAWPVLGSSGLRIGEVSAGDFAFKLANISWELVDADFLATNGGVGAVVSKFRGGDWQDPSDWESAAEQIESEEFLNYMNLAGGAHYLILHETAHTTELGLRTNNLQFDQYLHRGGDRSDGAAWSSSPEWLYNEQVANAIAKTIADAFGLEIIDHPTCGFPEGNGPPVRSAVII